MVLDKISKDIDTLRATIQKQVNSFDFNSITDTIYNSKENLFKMVKQHQVRKFNKLQDSPAHMNIAVPERISKKWVINLASKGLLPGEVKLLQRGPKFAVTSPKVPFTEYVAVTKQIGDKLGENTDGVNCSEYYQKLRIYSKTTNKSVHPILTSPKKKGRPSKPSKMTHG